jgi:hypothetical protein
MVGAILAILERVWKVASGESPLPSPEWADESYIEQCGELSDEEKKESFLSDRAVEISELIYKITGKKEEEEKEK